MAGNIREGYEVTGYPGLRPYYLYRPSALANIWRGREGCGRVRMSATSWAAATMFQLLWSRWEFMSTSCLRATWPPRILSRFDVILLGVRTYAAREELKTYNSRLLDYVKNGGVMIVQYNTPEFDHNFGPYPYVDGTKIPKR